MIGVRKSLDFIFTKYELKALDDLMPESHKEKNENDDEEVTMLSVHFLSFLSSTF
jgi:sodium bicarbonate transporter 10